MRVTRNLPVTVLSFFLFTVPSICKAAVWAVDVAWTDTAPTIDGKPDSAGFANVLFRWKYRRDSFVYVVFNSLEDDFHEGHLLFLTLPWGRKDMGGFLVRGKGRRSPIHLELRGLQSLSPG